MVSDIINKEKSNKIFPGINVRAEINFEYIAKADSWLFSQKFIQREEIIANAEVGKRDCESCEKEIWKPRWASTIHFKNCQYIC